MLAEGGTYDGLELANLARVELVMRRVQLVEYNHSYGFCEDVASNEAAVQERYLGMAGHDAAFNGLSPEEGNIMCSPALLDYVQGKVSKGQGEPKQIRKAREEAEMVKKSRGGRGRGRGKE